MKKTWLIKLIFSSLLLPLIAQSAEFSVIVRDGKKLETVVKELTDLTGQDTFDGKYFTIVKGKSEEAVKFSEDEETILKAATAYYHMTVAREYFKGLDPYGKHLDEKILVRIDHINKFSTVTKFAGDDYDPQFNNALTVEQSGFMKDDEVSPWNKEVWFRPAKPIKAKSSVTRVAEALNTQDFKGTLRESMVMSELVNMTSTLALTGTIPGVDMETHLFSIITSLGIAELIPIAFAWTTKNIKTKIYLDAVLIPEIIYHEYGHIAFGPWFGFSKQTPVVEGIPNYFAAKISGLKILAGKARKHSKGYAAKSSKGHMHYHSGLEDKPHTSFVLKLLVQAEKAFAVDAEKSFYKMVKEGKLNEDSDIRRDLVEALHVAANRSTRPDVTKIKLHQILSANGL